ncbi:MAG: Gfo/Idh/MocA family oxidoreductase [Verrucomicrobia bacterium]|nr:Gfo/Idh/MocA family oxidoreductase [Verrucomicrobiota bacterium]
MGDAFSDQIDKSKASLSKDKEIGPRVRVNPDMQFTGLDAFEKVLKSDIDVVILATPPGFRSMMFEAAVKAGKNIFMEKPVAVDGPGVQQVLAAAKVAKEKNLKVGVGLQRRHQPDYTQVIERLHGGAIGDIVSMRCYWNGTPVGPKKRRDDLAKQMGRAPTEMEYQIRNWYMFAWLCGDHIVEQHIHNLDVCNWIKNGYPVRCHGMGGRAYQQGPDSGEIFDHHAVEYEYEDGSHMFSQCRQIPSCWSSVTEHVTGTKGTCDVSGHIIRGDNAWRYKAREGESNAGHQLEHYPLMAAIRNNTPYNEAERGAMSSLTAIMGRIATWTGQPIEAKQVLDSKVKLMPDKLAWDATPKVLPGADGLYPFAVPGKNWKIHV